MLTLPPLLLLAFAGAPAPAQDVPPTWKLVQARGDGRCQMQVPPDWPLGKHKGSAYQTDSKASAVVGRPAEPTWQEVVGNARKYYKPTKVMEETERRFWFEYAGSTKAPGADWYVAVRQGDDVCVAQISFRDSSYQAEATRIAKSVSVRPR